MTKNISILRKIAKFWLKLFWSAVKRINYLPLLIAFVFIIIIFALIIPLVKSKEILLYNDQSITLSIVTSILAGCIIFLIVELSNKIFLAGEKDSYKSFYNDLFIVQGLENIFSSRGINEEYGKRILKANSRIWAIGMTNTNLIQHQLKNIIERVSNKEGLDVII